MTDKEYKNKCVDICSQIYTNRLAMNSSNIQRLLEINDSLQRKRAKELENANI